MLYSNFYARLYTARKGAIKVFKTIFHFHYSVYYLVIIGILQVLAWMQATFVYRNLSGDFLVLHYNVDFGVDFVAEPSRIFLWPLLGLVVFIINLIILTTLHGHRDFKLFIHLLLSAAALVGLLLNMVMLAVYLINFR